MDAFSEATSLRVNACGREWILERAGDLEKLWEVMTEDSANFEDERLPYWTELWPSSLALAEWLALSRHIISGKRCLDLGCGLGLTALVGAWLGASVMGVDYEIDALRFSRRNACINKIPSLEWILMDWRAPALKPGSIDVLWGGDIMYERRFVAPLLSFLRHVLAPDGYIWIAEPGRTVYEAFQLALYQQGWSAKRVHSSKIRPEYAPSVPVTIHIWELRR